MLVTIAVLRLSLLPEAFFDVGILTRLLLGWIVIPLVLFVAVLRSPFHIGRRFAIVIVDAGIVIAHYISVAPTFQ